MTRFQIDDLVVIKEPIITRNSGRQGIIVSIKPGMNKKSGEAKPDKYLVKFSDEDQEWFFELHLSQPDFELPFREIPKTF